MREAERSEGIVAQRSVALGLRHNNVERVRRVIRQLTGHKEGTSGRLRRRYRSWNTEAVGQK